MSRAGRPKQLLRFIRRPPGSPAKSLLELAAERVEGLVAPERRYICTSEAYRRAIRESLPAYSDAQILGEPASRDTVNAIGLAAVVLEREDPEATFVVLPADHIIEPVETLVRRVELGFRLAEHDPNRLVTFAVRPTYPATCYGYLERAAPITDIEGCNEDGQQLAYRVARVVEKPDRHRAEVYVRSGMFGWNSGLFVFRASTFLRCLERFKPESYDGLRQIGQAWGTERQQAVLEAVYPTLPRISVDYAVMEPASRDRQVTVAMVEMDLTWLDVGSWPSFAETLAPDEDENRCSGDGRVVVVHGRGNVVVNEQAGHTIALLGTGELIVVHTPDATLIVPRSEAEQLKELYARLDEDLR